MNITITDQEQCKKQLRLEIPAETVQAETDKVAAKLAKQIIVAGFRRGHVPKSVVKTRFRKELRDEVLSHLLPDSLAQAIQSKELKVIGQPSIEDLQHKDDESIDVTFNLDVAPEFSLSNYKELPLTRREYKVRDEDVEATVQRLREAQAELVTVEDRPSQAGDIVTVNLKGHIDASAEQTDQSESQTDQPQVDPQQSDEIKQEDLAVELGGSGVLKEFTEALTGVQAGDTREFAVQYPDEYKPENFAGRRVNYAAEVTALRIKELPEADDEFAHSVNEQFNAMDELRADIRSELEARAAHQSESELRTGTMEKLVDRNRFAVPKFVVDKQIDVRMQSLLRQMAGNGMDPRLLKVDWEAVRESQRERAEREVRGSFILERIAETEKIEVSEEELSEEIQKLAASVGQTPEALRARLTKEESLDSIKEQVKHRRALDLVIASAEIRTEEIEGLNADEATGEGGQADQ